MSSSGLKFTGLTEAEFERMREGPLGDVVRDRVAMIAADFHEQADKYRAMLAALEIRNEE